MTEENQNIRIRKVKSVTIIDRGVGMTPEILQNYFLRAGASFRSSSTWKENFEKPDGSSLVQRSGRFGVGALAAFLLGDEISVETRHYSEPSESGLKFSASIEASSINVVRTKCEIGTKIKIEIPGRLQEEVGDLLPDSDLSMVGSGNPIGNYFGRYPKLVYIVNASKLLWDEECLLPTREQKFEGPWNYFETDEFEVNWTYTRKGSVFEANSIYPRRVSELAVNQISISNYELNSGSDTGVRLYSKIFSVPSLSVGDNAGAFELNLQRSSYAASELPFCDILLREITDEFLYVCLWQLANSGPPIFPIYKGLERIYYDREPRWLDCSDGIILNEPRFLKRYDPTFCLNRYGGNSDSTFFEKIAGALPERSIYYHEKNDEFTARQFNMKGKLLQILRGRALNFVEKTTKKYTVFVPSAFVDLIIKDMRPGKDARNALEGLIKDTDPTWLLHSFGDVSEPAKILEWRQSMDKDGKDTCVVSLHSLSCQNFETRSENDDIVFDRWMDLLGQPYLPRDTNELSELRCRLSDRLGSKYEIFERRAQEAKRKKLEEKDENSEI